MMPIVQLSYEEITYLETILERLQGTGEAVEGVDGADHSQNILDKLEKAG
jgi:hypothetical protein